MLLPRYLNTDVKLGDVLFNGETAMLLIRSSPISSRALAPARADAAGSVQPMAGIISLFRSLTTSFISMTYIVTQDLIYVRHNNGLITSSTCPKDRKQDR